MPDYGHDLLFGTFITPLAAEPRRAVELAQLSERLGFDLVTVQDHPYQANFLDVLTLLSVMAASTTTIRLAPNVANLPLRPPAVLASSIASLDLLSGGRVELGLGAGGLWDAIEAYGGTRLTPREAVVGLEEGIEVIRALWDLSRRTVSFDGRIHRLVGARPGPAPAHPVQIWVGSYKPKMLQLTGRLADGWLPSSPYAGPEKLADLNASIDEAAAAAGRPPSAIRRLYNVSGSFTGTGSEFLQGPPSVWVEQLAGLALDEGMSAFIVMGDDPDLLHRVAAEVAPGVRELVAAERVARAG